MLFDIIQMMHGSELADCPADTSAAYSAAMPMLCHLHLVSLSAPYLGVYLLA